MKQNYQDCLTRLLKDEGGYTNDPSDSGGATNFGITIADYRHYINSKGQPIDVKNMTVDQAKTIYKAKYWDALNCDILSSGVDYTCFDYAVNSGLGRPRKALQRFKDKTGNDLIDAINDERTAFLEAIGHGKNVKFEAGWQARVKRVRNYSHYLNAHQPTDKIGPIMGSGIAGVCLTISQYWHAHQTAILISGGALAIAIGTAIHLYRNKGK